MSDFNEMAHRSRIEAEGLGQTHREPTGWTGWVFFGAMMMILVGVLQAMAGLVALFDDTYYAVTKNGLLLSWDYTAWGWAHMILGVLIVAVGVFLMRGATWARIGGVILCMISVVFNIGFLNANPLWAVIMITFDVLVIYAIIAHGGEMQEDY